MQGIITDDGSRTAASWEYRIQFKNSPPLTPADVYSRAGVSILFKKSWIEHHFLSKICRAFWVAAELFLRKCGISALAAIASFGLMDKVNANIVPHTRINYECHTADNILDGCSSGQKYYSLKGQLNFSRGKRDLIGYYLMAYHFPWGTRGNFNEGDNIEWLYDYLESQYEFLDDALYKLLGNNYFLGPLYDPWWHGFSDFYWAKDLEKKIIVLPEDKISPQWIELWGKFYFFDEPAQPGDLLSAYIGNIIVGQHIVSDKGWYNLRIFRDSPLTAYIDGAMPGDIMTFAALRSTGEMYPVEILSGIPRWTYHGNRIRVDLNAVPEPSSIILFAVAALVISVFRRKTNQAPDGYVC